MRITNCKVNHLHNPLGYSLGTPVFSYQVEESVGSKAVSASIAVSQNANLTSAIVIDSADSLATTLNVPLSPYTRYYWAATVETDAGETATSDVHWFETAKQHDTWQAQWIGCDSAESCHPVFTKVLPLEKAVQSARLYVCGLGLYEVYTNGRKLGDEMFAPYCNGYDKWLQYQTYDITESLATGSELSVLLGNGWYKGRFGFTSRPGQEGYYGDAWKLIAEARVTYTDGTKAVFGTDESWLVTRSQITFSNIYDGEHADATLPKTPPVAATLCEAPAAPLVARLSTPVTPYECFPARLIKTPAGETVFDIGQNIAGTFALRVHVPKGETVHVQFGEVLQEGNFYRDNLRTAKAEYLWVSDGEPRTLAPHFTFYGFRFAKVTGVPNAKAEDFTAYALYSQIEPIGALSTGHALVNKLIENTKWGQKGNFLDVPTDCPQRDERMGWTGDAQVFSTTALFLTDSYAFFRKYLYDIAQEQSAADGKVPDVVPSMGHTQCACAWGDATCIIPWNMYLFTGDVSILHEHYASMKAWVDYIRRIDGDAHAWAKQFHYGDWLALDHPSGGIDQTQGGTDEGFLANAYYRNSAILVAKAAAVLGKAEEAEAYNTLANNILEWIQAEYFTATGRCAIDTQTAHLLTLHWNLHADRERAKAMLRKSLEHAGEKLKTGFIGTPILCNVLSDNGMDDMAYRLLLNEDYPGWLHEVKLGATTIWERWNSINDDGSISSTGMNSLNHYAYGSIVEWIWRHAAGINPCETAPGFRRAILKPTPNWKLRHLDAVYHAAAGTYKVRWNCVDANHLEVCVTVPFGATAELTLPFSDEAPLELSAGSYQYRYETTHSLRKVYTTAMPIKELLANGAVRAALEHAIPQLTQVPASMQELSMREIMKQFAGGNIQVEMLNKIDAMLEMVD